MFKLSVNEFFWTWVTLPLEGSNGCEMPEVGSRIKVLGISSWIGGTATSLFHGVLIVKLSEAEESDCRAVAECHEKRGI